MSKILIVEDNALNMKLARDILEAKGHSVIAAENGEEGVAAAIENVPDLILMDIQMPGIDGFEALARIREKSEIASIPVIAFTASVTTSDRSKVTEAGFDAFISKPIDLKSFVTTVEETLAVDGT